MKRCVLAIENKFIVYRNAINEALDEMLADKISISKARAKVVQGFSEIVGMLEFAKDMDMIAYETEDNYLRKAKNMRVSALRVVLKKKQDMEEEQNEEA